MNVNEKIRAAFRKRLESEGLTVNSWARAAGVSEGGIRGFLGGRRKTITVQQMDKLAAAVGCSLVDFLTDETPDIDLKGVGRSVEELGGFAPDIDLTALHQAARTDAPASPTRRPTADRGTVASVSANDVEAAAGSGGAFVDREVTTGYYAFSRVWLRRRGLIVGKLSVISVTGDSMEPDLREGDLVLIDHAQTRPRDGLIYIVRYSDGLYAKRVQMLLGGQVDLVSSNSLYKPISVKLDEATDFDVIGRVVASVHEW